MFSILLLTMFSNPTAHLMNSPLLFSISSKLPDLAFSQGYQRWLIQEFDVIEIVAKIEVCVRELLMLNVIPSPLLKKKEKKTIFEAL